MGKKVSVRKKTKKSAPHSADGFKGWIRRHMIGVTVSVLALITLLGVFFYIGLAGYGGPDKWIYIPANATSQQLKDTLEAHLESSMASRVGLLWSLQGGNAEKAHGAYLIKHGQSALSISRALKNGRQTPIRVSFNNVRTLDQLAGKLTAKLECDSAEFLKACDRVLPAKGFKKAQYPAAFLPDTYEFYWTTTGDQLVEKLLDERNKFWTPDRCAKAELMGLSKVDVATLASIVEEESGKADERPKIARLYLNRLDKGMKLQADPTVKFAVGDFSLKRITQNHTKIESPYNTYQVKGLPPGPIRIVEKSTLDGVLNAPRHDYLYMCAKEDFSGYHNFATDYETHRANAARYQKELDRRNIH